MTARKPPAKGRAPAKKAVPRKVSARRAPTAPQSHEQAVSIANNKAASAPQKLTERELTLIPGKWGTRSREGRGNDGFSGTTRDCR